MKIIKNYLKKKKLKQTVRLITVAWFDLIVLRGWAGQTRNAREVFRLPIRKTVVLRWQ